MAAPLFSADAFRTGFLSLCPRGPIWPRDPDSVLYAVAGVLSAPFARNTTAANDLLIDAFPATAVDLLPEWESALDLPDPCAGPDPTIQQRQSQVVARLADNGGASIGYLTNYAATLGFPITITQFAPARADLLVADGPVYDPFWAFVWLVTTPSVTEIDFAADVSFADEPLASYGGTVLECEMQRLAPPHTVVLFAYTTANSS